MSKRAGADSYLEKKEDIRRNVQS